MGRLVKELSLRTEEQFDAHIVKLLKIIAEGGHILVSLKGNIKKMWYRLIWKDYFIRLAKMYLWLDEMIYLEFPQMFQSSFL